MFGGRAAMARVDVEALIAHMDREIRYQKRLIPAIVRETGLETYAPLHYAWPTYRAFLESYAPRKGGLLLCGLNPGPYGVGQTGIPFTDVRTAKARLNRIPFDRDIPGHAPPRLHDLLTLTWERSSLCMHTFFDHAYGGVEGAYEDLFVTAFSWLLFVDRARKPWNVTPADSPLRTRPDLERAASRMIRGLLPILEPRGVVMIGRHAEARIPSHLPQNLPRVAVRHPAREPPRTWGMDVARELTAASLL